MSRQPFAGIASASQRGQAHVALLGSQLQRLAGIGVEELSVAAEGGALVHQTSKCNIYQWEILQASYP
jgi:hypothetical protein